MAPLFSTRPKTMKSLPASDVDTLFDIVHAWSSIIALTRPVVSISEAGLAPVLLSLGLRPDTTGKTHRVAIRTHIYRMRSHQKGSPVSIVFIGAALWQI